MRDTCTHNQSHDSILQESKQQQQQNCNNSNISNIADIQHQFHIKYYTVKIISVLLVNYSLPTFLLIYYYN